MNEQIPEITVSKQRRGGFQKGISGNPSGKPRGTRSRANALMDRMFSKNPEDLQIVVAKTLSLAKAGEGWAVQAILSRLWPVPKGALMSFPLPPIKSAADVAAAQEGLLQAVANAKIPASVAVELSGIVERLGKALADTEIEARLAKLEKLATVQR